MKKIFLVPCALLIIVCMTFPAMAAEQDYVVQLYEGSGDAVVPVGNYYILFYDPDDVLRYSGHVHLKDDWCTVFRPDESFALEFCAQDGELSVTLFSDVGYDQNGYLYLRPYNVSGSTWLTEYLADVTDTFVQIIAAIDGLLFSGGILTIYAVLMVAVFGFVVGLGCLILWLALIRRR